MDTRLIDELALVPHPEGGFYRQTWVGQVEVGLPDGRDRPSATLIYFYLPAGTSSAWHRVRSDEIWLAHTGSVRLEYGDDGSAPELTHEVTLGIDLAGGQQPQAFIPGGIWQRTLPSDTDVLVSCVVSPGFDFEDFELA